MKIKNDIDWPKKDFRFLHVDIPFMSISAIRSVRLNCTTVDLMLWHHKPKGTLVQRQKNVIRWFMYARCTYPHSKAQDMYAQHAYMNQWVAFFCLWAKEPFILWHLPLWFITWYMYIYLVASLVVSRHCTESSHYCINITNGETSTFSCGNTQDRELLPKQKHFMCKGILWFYFTCKARLEIKGVFVSLKFADQDRVILRNCANNQRKLFGIKSMS